MKLQTANLQSIEQQLDTVALPEEHDVTPKLTEAFGEHTFFLNSDGLSIVEPHPAEEASGVVVKLASWSDDGTELHGHDPQVLPVTVELQPESPSPVH